MDFEVYLTYAIYWGVTILMILFTLSKGGGVKRDEE